VEKSFQANGPHKQAGVAILVIDKVDFRLKSIRRGKEGHFIFMKGTIHEEELSILNTKYRGSHLFYKNSNGVRAQIELTQ
jgi:hypothetical protein